MNALQTQELLTALTLIAIIVIASVKVGAFWIRLAFIDLLGLFFVKRLDVIGGLIGVNMVSDSISDLVSFLAIAVIIFAFMAAYFRRSYLFRAEQQRMSDLRQRHHATIQYLESIRNADQRLHRENWDDVKSMRPIEKAYQVRS